MDYQIQPGDTLSKIAKMYGVTVKQLQAANGIENPNLIFAGKTIKIPIESEKAFDIKGFYVERQGDGGQPKDTIPVAKGPIKFVPVYGVPKTPGKDGGQDPIKDPSQAVPLYGVPITPGKEDDEQPRDTFPIVKGPINFVPVYGVPKTPGKDGGKDEIKPILVDDQELVCHDTSGKTKDISGKLKVSEQGDKEYPKTFTITDNSSGKDHVYVYQLIGVDEKTGYPLYKCVSMNGRECITNNKYSLEKDKNGNPILLEHSDSDNYSHGLKFGKKIEDGDAGKVPGSKDSDGKVPGAKDGEKTDKEDGDDKVPGAKDGEKPGEKDDGKVPGSKDGEKTGKKDDPGKKDPLAISAEAKKKARSSGEEVGDYLIGPTDIDDQGLIKNIVTDNNKVNYKNVLEFLRGYADYKKNSIEGKIYGNDFFEQCRSEWSFGDKNWNEQDLIMNIGQKLQKHLELKGDSKNAEEIAIILKDGHVTKEEAAKLDEITNKYLENE